MQIQALLEAGIEDVNFPRRGKPFFYTENPAQIPRFEEIDYHETCKGFIGHLAPE